jgi:hypothetical protein
MIGKMSFYVRRVHSQIGLCVGVRAPLSASVYWGSLGIFHWKTHLLNNPLMKKDFLLSYVAAHLKVVHIASCGWGKNTIFFVFFWLTGRCYSIRLDRKVISS